MKSFYDKAQARIKRIEESLTHQPIVRLPGSKFFYVLGWTANDKVVSLGPFMGEPEASGELAKLADGEIFQYSTRDLTRATRQMKAELLSRGTDPDEALRKMLHQKGLEREQERKTWGRFDE